jgi:hypothetical protein
LHSCLCSAWILSIDFLGIPRPKFMSPALEESLSNVGRPSHSVSAQITNPAKWSYDQLCLNTLGTDEMIW